MIIRYLLIIISFGLLIWLLIESVSRLDIGATKNNGLINLAKSKVDKMQNIDSLKIYTMSSLDIIRQNRREESSLAVQRIWLIIGVIFIQVFLLISKRKGKAPVKDSNEHYK